MVVVVAIAAVGVIVIAIGFFLSLILFFSLANFQMLRPNGFPFPLARHKLSTEWLLPR